MDERRQPRGSFALGSLNERQEARAVLPEDWGAVWRGWVVSDLRPLKGRPEAWAGAHMRALCPGPFWGLEAILTGVLRVTGSMRNPLGFQVGSWKGRMGDLQAPSSCSRWALPRPPAEEVSGKPHRQCPLISARWEMWRCGLGPAGRSGEGSPGSHSASATGSPGWAEEGLHTLAAGTTPSPPGS